MKVRFLFHAAGIALSCGAVLALAPGCAAPRAAAPLPEPAPVPFGSVWVDPPRRELVISGFVNQVEGAIELFACGPGGKTHESVLVLFAEAADIQAALLLLGLKHGDPMPGLGMGPPRGDHVILEVFWEEEGRPRRARAEDFIYDHHARRKANHGAWVFNGSDFREGYFLARAEESYIATYWDPWAIINLSSRIGEDDERLSVNRKTIPPLHTLVRLVVRPGQQ